jgi:hypothetical protein
LIFFDLFIKSPGGPTCRRSPVLPTYPPDVSTSPT